VEAGQGGAMSVLDLIPTPWRIGLAALALSALAIFFFKIGGSWEAGRYVEEKAKAARQRDEQMGRVLADLRGAQEKGRLLALRVQANDETHQKELSSVQQNQKRLASRLATSELRLSVVLAATGHSASGEQLPAAASTVGVVHAGTRAELDPAFAQRVVAIAGDGDEGLTALAACQGYVKEILGANQYFPGSTDSDSP